MLSRSAAAAPRVSVITIFLNAEHYLAEAINSVLAQDFCDLELILVDDGSIDGGTTIARDYASRPGSMVRYVEHPSRANRGMSASRNLGLSAARGELVAFIDADDVWMPRKLSDQVAIMDAHPELGMVCGAVRYWTSWEGGEDTVVPTGHALNRVIPNPEASLALYPLGEAAAPCPSDLLLRRDLVLSLGGFEEHFTGPRQMYEDQGFLAKLYLAAPVYFSDSVWLNYRQHAESCVATMTREGRYHEVRHYFLEWLDGYLATLPQRDLRVVWALKKALLPYRHPWCHKALITAAGLAQYSLWAARQILSPLRQGSGGRTEPG